jgi:hypothetical protein
VAVAPEQVQREAGHHRAQQIEHREQPALDHHGLDREQHAHHDEQPADGHAGAHAHRAHDPLRVGVDGDRVEIVCGSSGRHDAS